MTQITQIPPVVQSPPERSPAPRRHWAWRLLTIPVAIVLMLAATVVGDWLQNNKPGTQEMAAPFAYPGKIGDVIEHPLFTVTVLGVRGSTKVLDVRDESYTTDGVFVLVEARITAREPVHLATIAAVDRSGRHFAAVDRVDQGITIGYRFEPGIPVEGEFAFEIPPDAGSGLTLWLSDDVHLVRNVFQRMVEVDLGIDQSTVDKWKAERRTLELKIPIIAR